MNVAMFAAAPVEPADPLDHLADVLFHRMGSPGSMAAPRSMKTSWSGLRR